MDEFADGLIDIASKHRSFGNNLETKISMNTNEILLMKSTIQNLSEALTISSRRVNLLELRLEGKISLEEYNRLKSMYASVDTDNHYLADQAVKRLMEIL